MVKNVNKRLGNSVATPAVRAAVRQMIESRLEHKRINAIGALADLPTAGVINTISMNVAQGDDIFNRAGDVIMPKEVRIRGHLRQAAASFGLLCARIIVFQDTLCNAATPTVLDVLATAHPLAAYSAVSKQTQRFRILHDQTHGLVGQTSSAETCFNFPLKLRGKIHFLGPTGVAGNQGRNSLFVLFISDVASAGNFQFAWSYDFEFTDA
jgi:hypothetical protein